jgi:hypothetical protein
MKEKIQFWTPCTLALQAILLYDDVKSASGLISKNVINLNQSV